MRANGSFAIRGNADFFSAAECEKAIRGNLRNVLQLIFRKLSLEKFPHSAKFPRPWSQHDGTRAQQ